VVEQFHIGQRVRLTRTLATRPEGLFRKGAAGTVMYMEEMVSIRMDQHFPRGIALETPLTNCSGVARRGDDRFYRWV
jgi:hypothetical protein